MKNARGYRRDYYEQRYEETLASARAILRILFDVVSPKRVLDVGCGVGAWLSVAKEFGAEKVMGVDGPWVDHDLFVIDETEFTEADLTAKRLRDVAVDGFDLALCLEVAEHLYEDRGELLVRDLTACAPVVLFSAAVPGQGGTGHVNERWQSYWVDHFRAHGFQAFDIIRPIVWEDERIKWWYRQNALVFSNLPLDVPGPVERARQGGMISVVHPDLAERGLDVYGWGRSVLKAVRRRAMSRLPWGGRDASKGKNAS